MQLQLTIPLWENEKGVSSTFKYQGQHYAVYLNFLEKTNEKSPLYSITIKSYEPKSTK
jgi:hypothetical protein